MRIRPATTSDISDLVHFNQAMALETEGKHLDPSTLHAGVSGLMENPHYGFYLVAESRDNTIAGGLMITYEWSDWRNACFWWIQSVYVLPNFRQQGIYRSLYEHVRALAEKEKNICGFRLYVEKENLAAQQAYQKLGMTECDYQMFES